jgi:GT2 family glycosyltransferase
VKVVYGMVTPGVVETETLDSLVSTIVRDSHRNRRITGKLMQFASANISRARNQIAKEFLENFDADWLWMIDSDMTWEPDALDRLLKVAHPDKAPIVGGLCFQWHAPTMDGLYRRASYVSPTMYTIEDERIMQVATWPKNSMAQVAATGTAFLIVHRGVFEKILTEYDWPLPWFAESIYNGELYGEDVTFCLRAGQMGFPVFVHTGVKVGHKKTRIITDADYVTLEDGFAADTG